MKHTLALSALLAVGLIATHAQASEVDPHGFNQQAPVVGKSRAQVKAELAAAIARGEPQAGDADPHGFNRQAVVSTKTRDQVRAEARQAKPVSVFNYQLGA